MSGRFLRRLTAWGWLCAVLTVTAGAQPQDRQNTAGYNAIIDNLDLLVDNYAKFLARKYDLTEEQDQYTKFLLRERAYSFLEKNEHDLRDLIDRMFEVRSGGEMMPEELVAWGAHAAPIYEEAKKIITEGNQEWREILTPEQKKIHDEDLRLMQQSFETTEEQLNRILTGDMTVDEFRSPYRARRPSRPRTPSPAPRAVEEPIEYEPPPYDEPPMPKEPPSAAPPRIQKPTVTPADRAAEQAGTKPRVSEQPGERTPQVTRPPARVERPGEGTAPGAPSDPRRGQIPGEVVQPGREAAQRAETEWEKYVRDFIEKYQLDDQQSQKAKAILEDCEQQKERYLSSKKEEIDLIDKQIAETQKSSDKNKSQTLAKLSDRKKKLSSPVDQIFNQQLKPRLDRLPTRAQRRAAEESTKKKPAAVKPRPEPAAPPAAKPRPEPEPEPEPQEPEPAPEPEPDPENE